MNEDAQVRFWSKVDKKGEDECWPWKGGKQSHGYGVFWDHRKPILAHRVALSLEMSIEINHNDIVDHKCGNRDCCNPKHLRICNASENRYNSRNGSRNKSGFKGVSVDVVAGKWQAHIYQNKKHFWLGRFATPEQAFNAYCEAAIRLHGKFVNFGGSR